MSEKNSQDSGKDSQLNHGNELLNTISDLIVSEQVSSGPQGRYGVETKEYSADPILRLHLSPATLANDRDRGLDQDGCYVLSQIPSVIRFLLAKEEFDPIHLYCHHDIDHEYSSKDEYGCEWVEPTLVKSNLGSINSVLAVEGTIPLADIGEWISEIAKIGDYREKTL